MQISNTGVELIKSFEGLSLKACKCVPTEKYYTIGYGHYGKDVKAEATITKTEALTLLKNDISKIEASANKSVKMLQTLNQNQYDALISFTYNCGVANLKKLVNNRTLTEISNKMLEYNKSGGKVLKGLQNRRVKEKALFDKPVKATINIDAIAKDVIKGVYGNGIKRKVTLTKLYGTDVYLAIQSKVNKLIRGDK